MREFLIRFFSIATIVLSLMIYNHISIVRMKDEQIARLEYEKAELEAAAAMPVAAANSVADASTEGTEAESASSDSDGTYQGSAQGYGGLITVDVTITGGKIAAINIVSAPNEDAAYLESAKGVINQIISTQSTGVDAISGATFSSTGIKNAVIDALGKIES